MSRILRCANGGDDVVVYWAGFGRRIEVMLPPEPGGTCPRSALQLRPSNVGFGDRGGPKELAVELGRDRSIALPNGERGPHLVSRVEREAAAHQSAGHAHGADGRHVHAQ
eukprot:CAMPEP_0114549608 /NCGR_PEP_ID=MMETSP0114-20121206/5618_1 /TAXON_ID=31324 /ORGANISM="Goniomonas sp, Strain m" /LENGTH=109 /DNA_ID=CAMNT_0001734301 /DNA_START=486 /DNA_END=813 /DNA_ORIENTATION=+